MSTSAVDVLIHDHSELLELFERVDDPNVDRTDMLMQIINRSAAHVSTERSVVYPFVKRRGIGNEKLWDRLHTEYVEIERLLVRIERRKFNSPDIPDLVTRLRDVSLDHAERSGPELCAAMGQRMTEHDLEHLGQKVDSAREVILSHPHPLLLSLGPISRFTTRLASVFDRMRDRTVRNR